MYLLKRRQKQSKHFESNWIFARNLKPDDLLKGRPHEQQYYPRTEDKLLKDLILQKKNVLVRGPPLVGKTRTVFEVLKNMDLSCDVIIPRSEDIDVEDYPFPSNSGPNPKVVILDDLDRFVEIKNIERIFKIIRDKNLIIVATCQTGDPFELIEQKLDLETIFKRNIINVGRVSEDEARQIARKENVDWNETEFDGTIGSIFLRLREMRKRYDALTETEKDLLKTIKKLQISGIYEGKHVFEYEWIETAFSAKYPDIKLDWEHLLTSLKGSELVSVTDEKNLHVEEVYLEKIVEFNDKQSELTILKEMLNTFSGKTDVLFNIGYRASSLALIRVEKRYFLRIAIIAYQEALKVYTLDEFPMDYAMTQNNLGNAYSDLASVEDRKNNLEKAIKAYQEALKVRTFAEFPIQYAMTQNNLGTAYSDLASVEDRKNNLEKAIKAYQEALKVYTLAEFPIQYATTQNNLGNAYSDLASVEDRKNNLEKAIKAYQEALKVRTFAEFPMDYAMTQNNLGNAYGDLASVEDRKNNLEKAIKAYQEALKVRTFAEFPIQYAMTQNNLGNAYWDLASVEDRKNNLEKAIKAYQEALKVRTFAEFPMDYAMTQNNLGTAYWDLASVEDRKNNLEKAIKAYQEALKVYTFAEFPIQYATIQNNLGNAYRDLASVEDRKNNLEKAIKAYQEALKVRTLDEFPIQYAMTQNNLGNAYRDLASVEYRKNNLEKAIKAYQEALKVRTLDEFPIQYAMTQNNLGIAYGDLASVEDRKNNLEKAIKAYQEALKVYEKENMQYYAEPLRQILPTLQAQLQQS